MMKMIAEQIAEGRRREALDPDLRETVSGWQSFIDDEGEQLLLFPDLTGPIAVELAPDEEQVAGSPRYLALLDEMKSLHIRKNAGYAGIGNPDPWANFRMSESFGVDALRGTLVRLSDKYIRVTNLLRNPDNDQVGESLRDTLMDLSAYALIAICLLEEGQRSTFPCCANGYDC